jgi:hypothetical protein
MAEESFIKKNIIGLLLLITVLGIAVYRFSQPPPQVIQVQDNYTEPYCVEWDETIPRENIVLLCFDFINLKQVCDWNAYPDGTLELSEYTNHSNVYAQYQCTKWVKTRYTPVKPIPVNIVQEPSPSNNTVL